MMTEELNWCMRDKTPQYAKWQAKDGDTVRFNDWELEWFN